MNATEPVAREVDVIYTGDVVRHADSHRIGIVLQIGQAQAIEYRVMLVSPADLFERETWWGGQEHWSQRFTKRAEGRDPYRRYLALCVVEDDPARREKRASHPRRRVRRFSGWLPEVVWDKMFWRLTNRRKLLPSGEYVSYDLGRDHWKVAAVDCLRRRDRSGGLTGAGIAR